MSHRVGILGLRSEDFRRPVAAKLAKTRCSKSGGRRGKDFLSPEGRLTLMRLLHVLPSLGGVEVQSSIRRLALDLVVTRHNVREILDFLVGKGWVSVVKPDCYRISNDLSVFIRDGSVVATPQMGVLIQVITRRFMKAEREAVRLRQKVHKLGVGRLPQKGLSKAAQYVLLLLFYLADQRGVVKGIGQTELARRAGMTVGRVHLMTKELQKTGWLKFVFSGNTAPPPLPRFTSAYVLNLEHPMLGADAVRPIRISCDNRIITFRNADSLGKRLSNVLQKHLNEMKSRSRDTHPLQLRKPDDLHTQKYLEIASSHLEYICRNRSVFAALLFALEEIAARLLESHANELEVLEDWNSGETVIPVGEFDREWIWLFCPLFGSSNRAYRKACRDLLVQIFGIGPTPIEGNEDAQGAEETLLDNLMEYLAFEVVALARSLITPLKETLLPSGIASRGVKLLLLPRDKALLQNRREIEVYGAYSHAKVFVATRSTASATNWVVKKIGNTGSD